MKVAFTGSSSTGKTTLAIRLKEDLIFSSLLPNFVTVDARSLLDKQGFQSMDRMSSEQLREFQIEYLERKLLLEQGLDNYFTDRSFVDVAAYWLERDAKDLLPSEVGSYVEHCRQEAVRYDIHFYFPTGLLQFDNDGYRSESCEFHQRVDDRIRNLLKEWKCEVVQLEMVDLTGRCNAVIETIKSRTKLG